MNGEQLDRIKRLFIKNGENSEREEQLKRIEHRKERANNPNYYHGHHIGSRGR